VRTVVSNASPLIGLAKIGKLDLMRGVFYKVFVPVEVFREVVEKGGRQNGF